MNSSNSIESNRHTEQKVRSVDDYTQRTSSSDEGENDNDKEKHLKKLDPDKFVEAYGDYGRYTEHTPKTNLLLDYGIGCSHWIIQELGLTIFTVGAVITVPFTSMLADRYGRRPVILIATIIALLANIAASFAPNYPVFLGLRAILGSASDTYISVGSVATCEFISEKLRAWITVVYNVAWPLGMLWTLSVTFITNEWRWRYLYIVTPGILSVIFICILPETPHWLIVKNKTEKLKKYIRVANKINNNSPDFEECQADKHHEEKHESFKVICSSPVMLKLVFANGYIQFVISLVYFAISFLSVEFDDSDHVSSFLYATVVEIPAGIAVLPLMIYLGRRTITTYCLLFQSVALALTAALCSYKNIKFVCLVVAKIMATIIYTVHPIWAAEQFPTSARSLCFSLTNIPQSIGIILSPAMKHLNPSKAYLPFLVVAVLSFISTALACALNETKNFKLPTDVRSASSISRVSNILSNSSDSLSTESPAPITPDKNTQSINKFSNQQPITSAEMRILMNDQAKTTTNGK